MRIGAWALEQNEREIFNHYMRMDPANKAARCFIEGKCVSLANRLFVDAQYWELLRNKLETAHEQG